MADTNRPVISVSTNANSQATRPPVQKQTDTVVETPPAAPTPQTVDPKLELFARKEKALRAQQRQLQAEKQAWEAERTKYQTEYMPKSRLIEDPLAVLTEAGVGIDKLSEILLNTPASANDPTIKALKAEIAAIKQQQTSAQEEAKASAEQQYHNAIKQITTEVKLMVDSNPELETIKNMGMQAAVVELMEQTFNKEGYLMDIADAAKQVEEFLLEDALRIAKLSKVQAKLAPTAQESQPTKQAVTQQQQIKTLTNSVSQQVPKRTSEKERRERAIAAFYNQLK